MIETVDFSSPILWLLLGLTWGSMITALLTEHRGSIKRAIRHLTEDGQ